MKILIAIPCMDQVPALFAQSLATLQKSGDCVIAMQMGSLIYASRNELGKTAIREEADYVFWLDSDMQFDSDILIRMLKTMQEKDLDILTGLYYRRTLPYTPVLFDKLEVKPSGACTWSEFEKIPEKGLFTVGGCGFGCVLMDVSVLMAVQQEYNTMFSPLGNTGEDLSFCWRARQRGYEIWCDPEIEVGHVGYAVVNGSYYRAFKEDGNEG